MTAEPMKDELEYRVRTVAAKLLLNRPGDLTQEEITAYVQNHVDRGKEAIDRLYEGRT